MTLYSIKQCQKKKRKEKTKRKRKIGRQQTQNSEITTAKLVLLLKGFERLSVKFYFKKEVYNKATSRRTYVRIMDSEY